MTDMSKPKTIQFIGGPLDGEQPVQPDMFWLLKVEGSPEGIYQLYQGNYWWVTPPGGAAGVLP